MSLGSRSFTMRLVDDTSSAAAQAKILIAESFRTRLGANPNTNHRHYLVIETKINGVPTVVACSSLSYGHEQNLFSENYLGMEVQAKVREELDFDIKRSEVCEIGSLSTNPAFIRSVRSVVAYFPWYAYRLGFKFALVTVTSYMRLALAQSGSNFESFCSANINVLPPEERSRWGKYYDYDPQTGVIELARMDFLDQIAIPNSTNSEMIIEPGCFGKVEACS